VKDRILSQYGEEVQIGEKAKGAVMIKKPNSKKSVPWEELAWSNMMHQEAVLRLLIEKGIITREEYLHKMRELKNEIEEKRSE
jgi:hypothetical protein